MAGSKQHKQQHQHQHIMFAAANSTWSRRSVLTVLVLAVALLACSTVMVREPLATVHKTLLRLG